MRYLTSRCLSYFYFTSLQLILLHLNTIEWMKIVCMLFYWIIYYHPVFSFKAICHNVNGLTRIMNKTFSIVTKWPNILVLVHYVERIHLTVSTCILWKSLLLIWWQRKNISRCFTFYYYYFLYLKYVVINNKWVKNFKISTRKISNNIIDS